MASPKPALRALNLKASLAGPVIMTEPAAPTKLFSSKTPGALPPDPRSSGGAPAAGSVRNGRACSALPFPHIVYEEAAYCLRQQPPRRLWFAAAATT